MEYILRKFSRLKCGERRIRQMSLVPRGEHFFLRNKKYLCIFGRARKWKYCQPYRENVDFSSSRVPHSYGKPVDAMNDIMNKRAWNSSYFVCVQLSAWMRYDFELLPQVKGKKEHTNDSGSHVFAMRFFQTVAFSIYRVQKNKKQRSNELSNLCAYLRVKRFCL